MRDLIMPSGPKPPRRRPVGRKAPILLMESISARERPVRHRKEYVDVIRTVFRVVLWASLILSAMALAVSRWAS